MCTGQKGGQGRSPPQACSQGEWLLLTRLVGLVGNVSKGREGRKIQRSWGARAVFNDLPGQLAF